MSDSIERKLFVGDTTAADNADSYGRAGRTGEQMVSMIHGKHYESARLGNIFFAWAVCTAPIIWSTEVGTGGPVIYNPSSTHVASILAVGYGVTTASGVIGALGFTGGYDQAATFATSTTITTGGGPNCLLVNNSSSRMEAYLDADTNTNRWFYPFASVTTRALTATDYRFNWLDVGGKFVVGEDAFIAISASATLTSFVADVCVVWEEVPV